MFNEMKRGAGEEGAATFELKQVDEQTGEFEGYASVFNVEDLGGDVVVPGAFKRTLRERPADRVKVLIAHDQTRPVGKLISAEEDGYGLKVRGRVLTEVRDGAEALALMRAGVLDAMSIGYRTKNYEIDQQRGVRVLKDVDLYEVSLVTFPMNERASISAVKGQPPTIRELERWLVRDAGLSAKQAKALLASGYDAIHSEREAGDDDGHKEAVELLMAADRIRKLAKGVME